MKQAQALHKGLVVDILSNSFDDNGSVNYVVKQDKSRAKRIRLLMEYSFDTCLEFGKVMLSDDDKACALILLPDKKKNTLNSLLWDIKLAVSVVGLGRVMKILKREATIKSYHPKKPFCYLWFIGVSPESQNHGKGSLLLEEIIAKSIQDGRQVYLETSMVNNLPWYQKHGFEIFEKINLPYTLYLLRWADKGC